MSTEQNGLSLGHVAKGGAGEFLVVADLIRRGVDVYRAVLSQARCDLVAVSSGRCVRIEVKTGFGWVSNEHSDVWAVANLLDPYKEVSYYGEAEHLDLLRVNGQPLPSLINFSAMHAAYLDRVRTRVLDDLRQTHRSESVAGLAKSIGASRPDTQRALFQLWKDEKIDRSKRGKMFVYRFRRPDGDVDEPRLPEWKSE